MRELHEYGCINADNVRFAAEVERIFKKTYQKLQRPLAKKKSATTLNLFGNHATGYHRVLSVCQEKFKSGIQLFSSKFTKTILQKQNSSQKIAHICW